MERINARAARREANLQGQFLPPEPQTVVIIVNSSVWDLNKRQKTRRRDFNRLNIQFTGRYDTKTCMNIFWFKFPARSVSQKF